MKEVRGPSSDRKLTTTNRPPVTDDARAEAQRRYQGDWDPYHGEPVDDFGFSDAERRAFMAGAEWAAGRAETTTATTGGTRPTPSRDELAALLLSFLKPPTTGGASWTFNPGAAADAVLDLLEGGTC